MLERNLAVLILTRNRLKLIQRLLGVGMFWEGLRWWKSQWTDGVSNTVHSARIVVLNQASADGTTAYLTGLAESQRHLVANARSPFDVPLDHHYSGKNLGCAGGRNALIAAAGLETPDDIAVFLDDDIVPISFQWLERLVAPLLAGEADISGVEGRVVDGQGRTHPAMGQPDYVSGGWMAVRNSIFMTGLRFDERFNPNYYEDVDLCKQAAERGARIVSVGEIGLLHTPDHGSSETLDGAASRKKYVEKWLQKVEAS